MQTFKGMLHFRQEACEWIYVRCCVSSLAERWTVSDTDDSRWCQWTVSNLKGPAAANVISKLLANYLATYCACCPSRPPGENVNWMRHRISVDFIVYLCVCVRIYTLCCVVHTVTSWGIISLHSIKIKSVWIKSLHIYCEYYIQCSAALHTKCTDAFWGLWGHLQNLLTEINDKLQWVWCKISII